jgi:2-dehydropantoate 2-reductase
LTGKATSIAIIGAGAVGGCLAGQLVASGDNRVCFAAGEERRSRLERAPLVVNGRRLELEVLPLERPAASLDLLVLAVKAPQLDGVLKEMVPFAGQEATILSLLNGIDSEERIAAKYGWERTLYGYVVQIDAIRSGNSVKSLSKGRFVFGRAKNRTMCERVRLTKEAFERAGVECDVPENMIRQLWWKFMVNVGMNPPSAILRAPYRTFQECPEAHSLMVESMREVISVAAAEGIALGEDDIAAWSSVLEGLDPDGQTSMLQDVEAGRPTEVDIFCGAMSRLGRKHQIPTPLNDLMYKILRGIEHVADKDGAAA